MRSQGGTRLGVPLLVGAIEHSDGHKRMIRNARSQGPGIAFELDREVRPAARADRSIPRELDRLAKELKVHQDVLEEEERRLPGSPARSTGGGAGGRVGQDPPPRARAAAVPDQEQSGVPGHDARDRGACGRRVTQFEDQALEILMQEEEIQKEIDRLQQSWPRRSASRCGVREHLHAELDRSARPNWRSRTAREMPSWIAYPLLCGPYERIRRSKGDLAVVGIEQGSCGGCGYPLPPAAGPGSPAEPGDRSLRGVRPDSRLDLEE